MSTLLSKSEVFDSLPPLWSEDVKPRIRELLAKRPEHKLVVLDDDPTGTQTVHDTPVLTTWDVEALKAEFALPGPCFYILTNSRSLVAADAKALNHEIATNLRTAASGKPFTVVSRSDSTLRGHFPLETDVLTEELGPFDATLIIPYFEAGGRYTIHDIHYVAEGDQLTPAAETPFAKDAVFGYANSNLREWVEEKTQGRVKAAEVATVSLDTIRVGGPQAVCDQLLGLAKGSTCIVNAAALADMDVFALGLLMAEQNGRRFLLRSAAQIVAACLGLAPRQLLTGEDLMTDGAGGGLIIVGSYVPKTTEQLEWLLEDMEQRRPRRSTVGEDSNDPCNGGDAVVPLFVPDLLDASRRSACLENALHTIHQALRANRNAVVFTSRELVTGTDSASNLDIGNGVSAALVELVQRLEVRPRYLIAKGGITSSDVATKGLGLKRGIVAGQILPGVPTWRVGKETRFPGMPYIVFPGNVGGPSALTDAVTRLSSH
jgi:uncharacterized protein YgbK (DUF1537 family)